MSEERTGSPWERTPGRRTDPSCLPHSADLAHRGTSPCFIRDSAAPGSAVNHESSASGAREDEPTHGTKSCSRLWIWQGTAPCLPKLQQMLIPIQDPTKGCFGNAFVLLLTSPWPVCLCFAFKERPVITGGNHYCTGEARKQIAEFLQSFSRPSRPPKRKWD